LPPSRLLICLDARLGLTLKEAFRIFGAVETGLLGRLGWRVDLVAERMEGDGYLTTDIFCKLACLRGFVNRDRSLSS
jgi:hypothetical protein